MTSYESSTIISNVERDQDQFRQKYAASLDSVDKTRSSLIFDIDECWRVYWCDVTKKRLHDCSKEGVVTFGDDGSSRPWLSVMAVETL